MWQDRKVELLEVELLVSSEMLFLFLQSCCMCILGDQMLCLRYCFCFVQNKFVFCKAIVGFYFGIVRDDILAVIVFRKTICF